MALQDHALDKSIYDNDAYLKAYGKYRTALKGNPNAPPPDTSKFLLPGKTAPNITGSAVGGGGIYGGKADTLDPIEAAKRSTTGNLANFDDLTNLTTKTNDLLAGEYTSRFPGYTDLANQNSLNIGAQLRGELPQDVINQIGQQAAERGIGGGVSGSQFSNSDFLRSLGLTSIAQQKTGADNYSRSLGDIKNIPLFDPTTMFTHPDDIYNAQNRQNDINAAPDPKLLGENNLKLALQPGLDQESKERLAQSKKDEENRKTLLKASRVSLGNPTGN